VIKSIIFKSKKGVGREEGRAREKAVFNFLIMVLCIGQAAQAKSQISGVYRGRFLCFSRMNFVNKL